MWTLAEVGERSLSVGGDGSVLKVLLNVLALVGLSVGCKLLQSVSLRHFLAHHRLLLAGKFLHLCLNLWEIGFLYRLTVLEQYIVEESVLNSWSKAELYARIQFLQSLGKEVG